ncbi:MAG: hypothetical protein LH702_18270, partial [Phormidesmis sp. CAN_BIN44]|nr:hypothetical protein [Phormidesmis sp. CAN_BIN44]
MFQQSRAAFTNYVSIKVTSTVEVILPSDRPSIPIRYNSTTQTLSFIGVMTDAERLALIAAGNPAELIDELSLLPRLAVKFYQPIFTASLDKLPPAVDFKTQLSADLAAKISYDIEQRLLRFAGIMSQAERTALDALVLNVLPTEVAYHSAINSLATQPKSIVSPDERIWLTDADLDVTQAANDTYAKRLTNAIAKALGYLSKTLTENAIVQQSSTQLGLTEALTRHLLADYPILPSRLLAHLAGNFALDATTFNGWYWVNRVATLLKKWKVTLAELEKITALTARAQLLDFQTLPLDSAGAIASLDRFLRTSRLLKLRDSLPETEITLLEVLEKLNSGGAYTKDSFADDVQLLNEAWPRADVKALTNTLNLTYPDDYLLAESWERLRRTFYFIDNLNASADKVKTFAAVAMTDFHAKTLKELLRSKFGTETWLTLSIEIQDALRERKRDALSAYLLTQAQPNPPSGKWENTNDLYAYYLLDVEMCSCQLTSRLVQASGSVQLFVQRCFMGLEPDVVVNADGDDRDSDMYSDSGWRWWKWMRKYRVWEANRKVFLWPENWIEPELKKDRSPFFKDLENELLQNEINQDTVEKAFINYLEKLDGVAQLEIAGFYQEDDGDKAIVHVFGRTHGAEPHLYYYRRYDYRQWTPWEKVELDIQGDYLIPAVVNNRLFLFWPVFTEVPNEAENSEVTIPSPGEPFTPKKAQKKLRLQMAVSDYRQGKWTPKRVSKDFDESGVYEVEIVKKHYIFFAVDHSDVDGRFGIKYAGRSVSSKQPPEAGAELSGSFEISGCKGIPEKTNLSGGFYHVVRPELVSNEVSRNEYTEFLKWVELNPRSDDDFTLVPFSPDVLAQVDPSPGLRDLVRSSPGLRAILKSSPGLWGILNSSSDLPITQLQTAVLLQTPWLFKMTPAWHLSYFDRLWLNWLLALDFIRDTKGLETYATAGTWLPFFYNDKKRTFFVLPTPTTNGARSYYPEIKKVVRQDEDAFKNQIQIRLKRIDLSNLRQAERQQLEDFFYQQFSEDTPPPSAITTPPSYTDDQVKELAKRWFMRLAHSSVGRKELLNFQSCQFHFKNFYHPFVCDFAKLVYNPLKGIPALMSRETQLKNSGFSFEQVYQPQAAVVKLPPQYPLLEDCYPKEVVDFTPDGAYSPYNWELFFHAPLLIANSLSKNQRFEEARDWYHFIFNPIGVEGT